jgi:hypothetical protein
LKLRKKPVTVFDETALTFCYNDLISVLGSFLLHVCTSYLLAILFLQATQVRLNTIQFCLTRPINYIRNVTGFASWNTQFNTPGHPEFPSANATNSAAIATMLTDVLGN